MGSAEHATRPRLRASPPSRYQLSLALASRRQVSGKSGRSFKEKRERVDMSGAKGRVVAQQAGAD
jgi:hypothetical protein